MIKKTKNMKNMKRLLLFFTLIIISAWNLKAQQENQSFLLLGEWAFEKAEYMELTPPSQMYQMKHGINSEDGLYAYSDCLQEVAKKIIFYDVQIATLDMLFGQNLGKYHFIPAPPSSANKQVLMKFGGIEDIGKESPIQGQKFNAPDVMYKIEYIDDNTIGIILEKACCDENFVITQAAIKCILKRKM